MTIYKYLGVVAYLKILSKALGSDSGKPLKTSVRIVDSLSKT